MARRKDTVRPDLLARALPRDAVAAEARRVGAVKRARKVDVYVLVWTLCLGFGVGARRTLTGLRQAYGRAAGETLAPSAFYGRLNGALAKVLRWASLELARQLDGAAHVPAALGRGFRDIVALDSTVVRLHRLLDGRYPGCRTNVTKAAAKLHTVYSIADMTTRRVKLTSERTADVTPWRRVEDWVRGCLLVFDLGYFKFHMFDRIDAHGGFFLSRLKENVNPTIVGLNRRDRGRKVAVVGQRLRDALPRIQRGFLDVTAEVSFGKRHYRGRSATTTRTFRVIAVKHPTTGSYHCYITNVPADRLPAEDVTPLYALRWQIEILFKAMKSHGRLDQVATSNPDLADCLLWASVASALASQLLHRAVRQHLANRSVPLLRWNALFARLAADILALLVTPAPRRAARLVALILHEAPDPNRRRTSLAACSAA